jgi:hypothetical protein
MKTANDTKTADLLPAHDLAGERPSMPSRAAQRIAKMREAKGLKGLTVNIPAELVDQFHAKRKEQGKTANEAIAHLLRTQFLRKR